MRLRHLFLMTCVCAAALCPQGAAWAQGSVNVRTGTHAEYSRLVFDWATSVPYTVTRAGTDTIEIVFQKAANMNASGVDSASAPGIRGVEKLSAEGENLKVRVKIPEGAEYRHFLVGDRVVLDVFEKTGVPPPKAAVQEPKSTPAPPAKMVEAPVAKPVIRQEGPPVSALPAPAIVEEKSQPVPTVVETAMQKSIQSHMITISSTKEIGLAAFMRNDRLWIVLDRNDVTVPPQISGPQVGLFTPFERLDIDGGVAYSTTVPEGINITGEGGGLVWRLIVSALPHEKIPASPERSFDKGQMIRGGTLMWPLQRVTKTLVMIDPDAGDKIFVGTVDQSDQFAGAARDFVDFATLDSPVGIAILPRADDLQAEPQGLGLRVTRPGGLALSRMRDINQTPIEKQVSGGDERKQAGADQLKRMYDFDRWTMGGVQALRENQQVLLSGMGGKDKTGKVQDLLMMAKMNMANDRGQEAVGLLNFAQNELPEIVESPEFLALRGGAEALAGKFELAFEDLSVPALKDYGELDYWRTYILASLEDWQQAKVAMPKDFDLLFSYPRLIRERLALRLAEVALRAGDRLKAEELLNHLEMERKLLKPWSVAGLDYLQGEIHRQAGETTRATEVWKPLSAGKDDLYRTKASLAMTMMELQDKTITPETAIDRLEGLRYHWRGDELEARINYVLGKMYLDQKRYLKGFTILRDAVAMSPDTDIGREVTGFMTDSFKSLFLSAQVNELTPIDAVTVYEEFRELTPPGDEGNKLVQRLAERLVDADLLARAAALLQHQVDYRVSGREGGDVAVRLGAIYLLNEEPDKAITALDKAKSNYAALEQSAAVMEKQKEIQMLRARALSDKDQVEEALDILNAFSTSPDINALRADISWNAGMWDDAADALRDLILDESIDVARPLTQKQADLILNRAVALNLAGDRVELSNMRTRYGEAMGKSSRSKMFDVVTRARTGNMSERDSIAALVSEVDMFKDFLDSYRAGNPSN